MAWQRTRIALPDGLAKDDRVAIASEIIDHIIDRSKSGSGINPSTGRNKKFRPYSEEYAKAKGQTNVDLTLRDTMLRAMRLLSDNKDSLLIGYENGTKENAKAEGNQVAHGRPFLGISTAALRKIVEKYE